MIQFWNRECLPKSTRNEEVNSSIRFLYKYILFYLYSSYTLAWSYSTDHSQAVAHTPSISIPRQLSLPSSIGRIKWWEKGQYLGWADSTNRAQLHTQLCLPSNRISLQRMSIGYISSPLCRPHNRGRCWTWPWRQLSQGMSQRDKQQDNIRLIWSQLRN